MSCDQCSGCGSCGGVSGAAIYLTPEEIEMLRLFTQTPFLPAAAKSGPDGPIFLEEAAIPLQDRRSALRGLAKKGLIRVDYDIPLLNFDYGAYTDYPLHGSMALTARGQTVTELMEIQGIEA